MLTQVTRAASRNGVDLESAEMEIRAHFPHGAKYDLEDPRTAAELLTYTLDLRTDSPLEQVREVVRWAEHACHVVNTFREPVDVLPNLRVNGSEVPVREWLGQ